MARCLFFVAMLYARGGLGPASECSQGQVFYGQSRLDNNMPFDHQIIEARLALDRIGPNEMPALACDALEAGFDGPRIRRLAALTDPSGWEVDQILPAFMAEAGLSVIPRQEAAVRIARQIALKILSEKLDPTAHTKDFELLWIEAGYPRILREAGTLDDEKYLFGENETEFCEYARKILTALITTPEP